MATEFRRYQRTLPGIVPSRCDRHNDRINRLEDKFDDFAESLAHVRGQVDVLVQKLCASRSVRPAWAPSAKTIGAIVGALIGAAGAAGAAWGWLG